MARKLSKLADEYCKRLLFINGRAKNLLDVEVTTTTFLKGFFYSELCEFNFAARYLNRFISRLLQSRISLLNYESDGHGQVIR